MQTRVRTRLRRYYFSPLAPFTCLKALPPRRLRFACASKSPRSLAGLQRASVAAAPCLLSELPSPTYFRCRF